MGDELSGQGFKLFIFGIRNRNSESIHYLSALPLYFFECVVYRWRQKRNVRFNAEARRTRRKRRGHTNRRSSPLSSSLRNLRVLRASALNRSSTKGQLYSFRLNITFSALFSFQPRIEFFSIAQSLLCSGGLPFLFQRGAQLIPGLRGFGIEFGRGLEPFDGLVQFAFFEPLNAEADCVERGFALLSELD